MRRENYWCANFSLVKNSANKINPTPALYPSSKNTNSGEWDNISFTQIKYEFDALLQNNNKIKNNGRCDQYDMYKQF